MTVGEQENGPAESASPERGRRGGGLCGVIGCLAIIAILVAIGAGSMFVGGQLEPIADRYLWAPHDVVREYLAAYQDGDFERARRFVCSDIKSAGLPDPAAPVGDPNSWSASVDDEFPYPRPEGQVAIYYLVRSGVGDRRAQVLLEREEDGWRICAVTTG
jgi:hypothetical protein